ncbi:PEP-CTERM putative exosortase interaction domain-containing protein [Rivularia sp. PCC 7116]|uniref:PEP-CTERM sorting domain-containing protein n=1 Tax=Rivularia sp. PCC 7116 TaxID=373994 RepID=UPI00029F10E3|nr:PEP-CTERM sorting domain-containing protein [Rivularia sp. PCC 7116]AFY58864.1 PEP-CTERM putative exosortase interaction domain-containing protein [Rivularia sp. PCC 7116]
MTFSKSSTIKTVKNPAQALESTTVENEIEEIQKLQKEISKLQKDTRNLNTQILEAKNNENNKEGNRLLQEKICIKNELKIKEEKLNKLLIADDSFNKNTQLKNDCGDKRVLEPTSILDLSPVSGFVNSSLKRGRINNLVSKLGIGALLATALTVGANPAQAGIFTNETTVNFDEPDVDVSLEAKDNPLYGGKKINNAWADYGLKIKSSVNELWLYDSSTKGGRDDDLLTGYGQYEHKGNTIEYKSPEQGNVLIIQEHDERFKNDIKTLESQIKNLKKEIQNTSDQDILTQKQNQLETKQAERQQKIEAIKNDLNNNKNTYVKNNETKNYDLRPDDNVGGTITFDFTDDVGVLFDSIGLLDFDETKQPKFNAFFADGTKTGNFWLGSNKGNKYIDSVDLLSTNLDGTKEVKDDNSLREYKFDFSDKKVTKFQIKLPGSGAITGLNYYREDTPDFARKVPEPTSILGLAAMSALAASSLKRKRKSSNI